MKLLKYTFICLKMAALLKHAQLSKQFQLEVVIKKDDKEVVFHNKLGFIPIVGQYALFKPDESEWYNIQNVEDLIKSMELKENNIYTLTITSINPGDANSFEYKGGLFDHYLFHDGAELESTLKRVLKLYAAYTAQEYEK